MSKLRQRAFLTVTAATALVIAITGLAQQTSIRLPADNPMAQLKSGAGEDVARKDCGLCHSTDYIVIQPHLTAKQWDAEVQKMIKIYGAPIGPGDSKIISDYLAAIYAGDGASLTKSEPANKNESAAH